VSGPLLDEKILAVRRQLVDRDIPHAFGGALALAYYATPRGTEDIDINVFVRASQADRVLGPLAELGVARATAADRTRLRRDGQVRLYWGRTPLDLFFSYDALHDACRERSRTVAFGSDEIEILSAEDLVIFKVLFDRDKDWVDIGHLLFAMEGEFDAEYATGWLGRIVDADDARLARFMQLLADRT
jgi:hypothetical protein